MTEAPSRPRRIAFLAGAIWLLTLALGLSTLWVGLFTDSLEQMAVANGATPISDGLLVFRAVVIAFSAVAVAYASVGALLAGRVGAGRIAALLLGGGALFALVPFGYLTGLRSEGTCSAEHRKIPPIFGRLVESRHGVLIAPAAVRTEGMRFG